MKYERARAESLGSTGFALGGCEKHVALELQQGKEVPETDVRCIGQGVTMNDDRDAADKADAASARTCR